MRRRHPSSRCYGSIPTASSSPCLLASSSRPCSEVDYFSFFRFCTCTPTCMMHAYSILPLFVASPHQPMLLSVFSVVASPTLKMIVCILCCSASPMRSHEQQCQSASQQDPVPCLLLGMPYDVCHCSLFLIFSAWRIKALINRIKASLWQLSNKYSNGARALAASSKNC